MKPDKLSNLKNLVELQSLKCNILLEQANFDDQQSMNKYIKCVRKYRLYSDKLFSESFRGKN